MGPDKRAFKYRFSDDVTVTSSEDQDLHNLVQVNTFIEDKPFVDQTPFTQWTIEVDDFSLYDMSNLIDIKLIWKGRFNIDNN